jgi:hypothetical protein
MLSANMKYWEIIADNLTKAGWSWGCVSAIDSSERSIYDTPHMTLVFLTFNVGVLAAQV